MLVVALALRMVHISALPSDFHVDRQYFAALITQADFDDHVHASADLRRAADANRTNEGTLEPPIMETLALWGDEIVGHETLVIPGVLASVFWVAGDVFLYLLMVRLVSVSGAFASSAFYLFAPFGVAASRAFMPDPLMVSLALLAVYLALRYHQSPSRASLLWAAAAGAVAIWSKPMCAFLVLPAFFALQFASRGFKSSAERSRTVLYCAVVVIPPAAFYLVNKLTGAFPSDAGTTINLDLYFHASFWHEWLQMADEVLRFGVLRGEIVIVLAVLGLLVSRGWARWLLVGLYVGFFAYGIVFATHIATHDYYSLMLVPIVAIALGVLCDWILVRLRTWRPRAAMVATAIAVIAVVGYAAATWADGSPIYDNLNAPQAQVPSLALDRTIGADVDHSSRVVFLAQNYGLTIAYYGGVGAAAFWPNAFDRNFAALQGQAPLTAAAEFQQIMRASHPQWFVVTWPQQFEQQPDLMKFLRTHFRLAARGSSYWVYDLRAPLPT